MYLEVIECGSKRPADPSFAGLVHIFAPFALRF